MDSAPPSLHATTLDPASIPRYSVIRLPYRFGTASYTERKRFVVLGHQKGHAICLKATSKVDVYKNNPEKLAGCVFYKAGEVEIFPEETAIQPDNQIPIPHTHLLMMHGKGALEWLGSLPADFETKLRAAIDNSTTLDDRQISRLLDLLGRTS